jgi:hypothetical protein
LFKNLRILILLLALLAVLIYGWIPSSPQPDWNESLRVAVFPINGDGSDEAAAFINSFSPSDLADLEGYFSSHANRYGLPLDTPFLFEIGPEIQQAPDVPASDLSDWERLKWAIKLRWAHWNLRRKLPGTDIVLVARFQRAAEGPIDLHSIGMPAPRLALVSLIASASAKGLNDVKIAHELLHTVGASDVYDPITQEPLWPSGYADPERQPLFPQPAAELMAGRVPLSALRSRQAGAIEATTVGSATAREIGWINSLGDLFDLPRKRTTATIGRASQD